MNRMGHFWLVEPAFFLLPAVLLLQLASTAAAAAAAAAEPATASYTASGGAYGIAASGPQPLAPTPHVRLPPGGSTQVASSAPLSLRRLLNTGPLTSTTQASAYGRANETVASSSSDQTVTFHGAYSSLRISAVSASCSATLSASGAKSSVGQIDVNGSPVGLPDSTNVFLSPSSLGKLAGKLTIELNVEERSTSASLSTIARSAVDVDLTSLKEKIEVAHVICGVGD